MQAISQAPLEASETTWYVPECPFTIDWAAAVLEEIRLAVVDAFVSLPHGGAEIGGVLFGTREGGRVRILAWRPLDCEHALGPTFTLSQNDHERLRELLEESRRDLHAQGLEPVGWYHSHTRSEIFLSPQDVAIYDRYFPDPWHVALVLRPHALKPVRAGFFFRESGGYIQVDASYREFMVRPPASAPSRPVEQPLVDPPEITPAAIPAAIPVPPFLNTPERKLPWQWLWWASGVLAIGAGFFAFTQDWMHGPPRQQPPTLSLIAYDLDGQVQICWDRTGDPIRAASAGTLEISDGAVHAVIPLDKRQLQTGMFGYARQSARVDARLAVDQPGGTQIEGSASFLGREPADKPAADPKLGAEVLRQELHDQAVRTRRLERVIGDMRAEIRREQERRRMEAQLQSNH